MSEQEMKAELERIERYIEQTKMKEDVRYTIMLNEALALHREGLEGDVKLYNIIMLAFNYGRAKGYRKAKREAGKR